MGWEVLGAFLGGIVIGFVISALMSSSTINSREDEMREYFKRELERMREEDKNDKG